MPVSAGSAHPVSRLERLLGFLDEDPTNLQLMEDAATAALDEGLTAQTAKLLRSYAAIAPLPQGMLNLEGLLSMHERKFADAAAVFEDLLQRNPADRALCFNLAWCRAMLNDYAGASALLDDESAAASVQAAALKIYVLHHLGDLEGALAWGMGLGQRYPGETALMGALANVAIDAEDMGLADYYAGLAGDSPDGLAARGVLLLSSDRIDESLGLFEQALGANPKNARALLGKGLVLIAKGDLGESTDYIDHAAALFARHLGSWVAAGWAYFIKGDYATSRARFETALALDDTFAETHGGLAVLDVIEGRLDDARRRLEIALRLDRKCFAAALAQSLILAGEGDRRKSERVLKIALNTPIGQDGRTIAGAMVGIGLAARTPK